MFFLLFRCFFSQRPLLCCECDIWGVQQYNIHKCGRFSSPATSLGCKYGLSPSFYVLNLKGEKENCEGSIIVTCVGGLFIWFLFTSTSFIHRDTVEHWNGAEAFFSFLSQLSEFLLHFLIVSTWPPLLPPLLRPWAKAGLGMIRANILFPAINFSIVIANWKCNWIRWSNELISNSAPKLKPSSLFSKPTHCSSIFSNVHHWQKFFCLPFSK